ncbi:hypothetical protein PoB_006020300 [Plakobranchus ocellatus]|uniref:Uncharacterized protein n=1 Tax=Plakobranchus ocellatus TaxID=259542 RepID=A0AAV4CP81_9GAST|nr:hypothetical protein PoB_006020300 [Plakobranchus ocellatus]
MRSKLAQSKSKIIILNRGGTNFSDEIYKTENRQQKPVHPPKDTDHNIWRQLEKQSQKHRKKQHKNNIPTNSTYYQIKHVGKFSRRPALRAQHSLKDIMHLP